MTERRYRVLFVGSHPVQYAAPVFREMAQRGDLDIQVAYCTLQGAEPGVDAGFGVEVAWDVPLLEGYPWVRVANRSLWPRLFRLADVVIVPSSRSVAMMRSLDIPGERVALTPYVVDNEWWTREAERADPVAVRREWNVPESAAVALFCAKLQPWKRPE